MIFKLDFLFLFDAHAGLVYDTVLIDLLKVMEIPSGFPNQ